MLTGVFGETLVKDLNDTYLS